MHLKYSLGAFPYSTSSGFYPLLPSDVSWGTNEHSSDASKTILFSNPHRQLKAGYTAHSCEPQCRFNPIRSPKRPTGSPRKLGRALTCHCEPPFFLNSQHQPPTGRQRPTPETSSMCHMRIFRPAFETGSTD